MKIIAFQCSCVGKIWNKNFCVASFYEVITKHFLKTFCYVDFQDKKKIQKTKTHKQFETAGAPKL